MTAVLYNRTTSHLFSDCLEKLHSNIVMRASQLGVKQLTKHRIGNVSNLPAGRQEIITKARESKCDYLLCIDDDMRFPPDAFERLISHKVGVVGINYVCKLNILKNTASSHPGIRIDSRKSSGLEQVYAIGLGMVLIDMHAIEHIPLPHFEILWDRMTQTHIGEDEYFCRKLHEYKVPIHVDHDLSNCVGHIGEYVYTSDSFKIG